eukprot:g19651.t1
MGCQDGKDRAGATAEVNSPSLQGGPAFAAIVAQRSSNETGLALTDVGFLGPDDFAELMKPDIIPKLWGKVAAQVMDDPYSKETVQAAVVRDGRALAHAAPPLKQDKEVVLKAVQADGSALMFASEELQRDKEKMGGRSSQVLTLNSFLLSHTDHGEEVVLAAVSCDGQVLSLATALIADKEVALAAVKQSGKALQHCSEQLRNDEESWVGKQAEGRTVKGQRLNRVVVDAAMENNTEALPYTTGELKQEWEEILTKRWKEQGFHLQRRKAGQILRAQTLAASWAVSGLLDEIERGEVELQDLDEGARNDFPLVLAAVRASQGRALEHASWALRGEKAIVLEAVKRNGLALRHAQMTLRADRDVVLTAVRDCPLALEHAAETVRRDRDELRQDQPFALELLRTFPGAWVYLAKELKDSRDFLLCALQQNGEVLRYAAGWHSDAEAALTAVQKASHAVHYVDSRLRQRGEFARAAVMVNPWAFEQLGSHHRGNLQLALAAARARPALAQFAGESIRNDAWSWGLRAEVVYLIKKEQSEAVGAPQGYVEGPVWWTPEAFKPLVETTGQKAAPRRCVWMAVARSFRGLGMGKVGSAKAEPKKEPAEKAKAADKSKDAKPKAEAKAEPAKEDPKAKLLEEAKQKYADDEPLGPT